MTKKKRHVVLVVDSDRDNLKSLSADPKTTQVLPVGTTSLKDAKGVLSDPETGVVGTFVSTNLPDCEWISVVEESHRQRPATPIFLVTDSGSELELNDDDLKGLGIRQSIGRPLDYKHMVELVAPLAVGFDVDSALEKAKENTDTVGGVSSSKDDAFVPIRADNFLSGSKSIFDMYIRIATDHFLKILQAGDGFDSERLEKYLKKGVTHFYLRKEVQETYLRYCEHLTTRILKSKNVPIQFKVAQTINQGEETSKFLKGSGLNEDQIRHANNFVSNVQTVLHQLKPDRAGALRSFLADAMACDHGVGTSMIAALIAEPLMVGFGHAVQIIGLAAFLHDIGLQKMPPEVQAEDEDWMNKEQLRQYYTHPEVGANLLEKMRDIDPAVPHAIAAHHVRKENRGFPKHIGATRINQAAEVVGISDEFLRLILKMKKRPELQIKPLEAMEKEIFPGFSRPVVEAFRKAFFIKK